MRAGFAAGRITPAIIETRPQTALNGFDNFFVLHLNTTQIGADRRLIVDLCPRRN